MTSDDLKRLWEETRTLPGVDLATWPPEMPVNKLLLFEGIAGQRSMEGPSGWRAVLAALARSAHCNGRTTARWRASPDFLLDAKGQGVIGKLLAGGYDDGTGPEPKKGGWTNPADSKHPEKGGELEIP